MFFYASKGARVRVLTAIKTRAQRGGWRGEQRASAPALPLPRCWLSCPFLFFCGGDWPAATRLPPPTESRLFISFSLFFRPLPPLATPPTAAELSSRPYWRVNTWDPDDAWSSVCHGKAEDARRDAVESAAAPPCCMLWRGVDRQRRRSAKDAARPVHFQSPTLPLPTTHLHTPPYPLPTRRSFDPHGLLYCAEGDLDKGVLRSPDLYGRLADTVEHLVTCATTTADSRPTAPPHD